MPLPFFCAVCDKPIPPSLHRKYKTMHEECMVEYLDKFSVATTKEFNKNLTSTLKKNKK